MKKMDIQDGTGSWPKGTCLTCVRDYSNCEHRSIQAQQDRERAAMMRRAARAHRGREISYICSKYELESDEGGTAEQKALQFMASK